MSKHTPGPWQIGHYTGDIYENKSDESPGNRRIAAIIGESSGLFGAEESHANARLIAGAPDLLAALELALDCMDRNIGDCPEDDDKRAHDNARAAILKAKGESA